jgi:ferrous iron transport protein A
MVAIHQRICLSEMAVGEDATILDFHHGCAFQNRLVSLGFTRGALVSMTQNYGHGPLIVTVRGTRVALGRGEAAKIIVERSTP